LANIAVAVFKVNLWWGEFWKPYIDKAVGGKVDFMVLIGGVEEQAIVQWERSM
jgi:hypothetical protein